MGTEAYTWAAPADLVGRFLLMGLLEDTGFMAELFRDAGYWTPFVVLLLCGVGLPLPEEVPLILSGLLYFKGEVEFVPIVAVCSLAILLGDSAPFLLGRRYGKSALRFEWVAKILHPERFARLEDRFEEHGNWATFCFRFLPGMRIPGYFVAGTMGMRYGRFVLLDLLGVMISVPLSIWAAAKFGHQIEKLEAEISNLHTILAFLVASLALIMWYRSRKARLAKQAAQEQFARHCAEAAPLAPTVPDSADSSSPGEERQSD